MVQLPETLVEAIEAEVGQEPAARLEKAQAELSACYRTAAGGICPTPWRDEHYRAYLVARFPATFAATYVVLDEILKLGGGGATGWETVIDVCAGPGTALLALAALGLRPKRAWLLERDSNFLAIARRLAEHVGGTADGTEYCRAEAAEGLESIGMPADLVVCAYGLGEQSSAEARAELLRAAWERTKGVLVVVEPGTPQGARTIFEGRRMLLELGAHLWGPCPHAASCPLETSERRWCHFSVRLARSRLHRMLKGGTLTYEDERFSYVVAARFAPPSPSNARARVISFPRLTNAGVKFEGCLADGRAERILIPKREREAYRVARDLRWGATVPDHVLAVRVVRGAVQ
ncbi:MAG: small ribosomal subunit Rsm22 family protein [Candidatus Sumerlaea chitinivorans]|jgi:ribosomal protein RSM22 (predicted rRNA methylase)|uniref:Methyltransferase n=1 Tax=Sumerlaea chitinivorans TaxID=2250252 RepID=A0A2Z4Y7W2_SUMC1|nr:Methyltransferase [Candidatus Sumerlaea chitinivorans]MCX7964536.1 small ribosomal subunit Rsm22 family protein [Candidatus Sumerlaea chitinivorans]